MPVVRICAPLMERPARRLAPWPRSFAQRTKPRRSRWWPGWAMGCRSPPPTRPHLLSGSTQPPAHAKYDGGDVSATILALLAEGPHNGYQLIREIETAAHGGRPRRGVPGASLSDEELVLPGNDGRMTRDEQTEVGRAVTTENADEVDAPWKSMIPQFAEGARAFRNGPSRRRPR